MPDLTNEKDFKKTKTENKNETRVKELQDRFKEIEEAEKKKGLRNKLSKWNQLYVPHQFNKFGLKRWQSKSAKNVAFTKINTALAVMIESNPEFSFFQRANQDKPSIPLWKSLLSYIDDVGNSRVQLKRFFFNSAKDGTAIGQAYWKYDTRKVKFEVSYDPEKDISEYEEKVIEDFNNPCWTVLERKDAYIDDKATSWNPTDEHPIRDWFKRVIYDEDDFETRFPEEKYPEIKDCKPGGELAEEGTDKTMLSVGKKQYEVLFYENKPKDQFAILCNGVLLRDRPLPYRHKQLSIFGTKWSENPDSIDGIGICEMIENDEAMLDNLANATIDEINLLIRRVLIIGYGEELSDEELILEPNKVLRLRDPAVAKWLEKSSLGADPFNQQSFIKADIDEKTGVTKELMGAMPSRRQTATETAINREAGLRRIKTPLENVEDAMEIKERLIIGLTKQIYSIPTKKELDEKGIEVLAEYRKVRLPVEQKGERIIPSEKENIIEITPSTLMAEPDIKIKHMSMMPISKALQKQETMQLYSIIGSHPYIDTYKAARNVCEAFEVDADDWLRTEEDIAKQQQAAQGAMTGMEGMAKGPVGAPTGAPTGGPAGTAAPTRTTVPTEAGGATEVPIGGKQSAFKQFLGAITGRR